MTSRVPLNDTERWDLQRFRADNERLRARIAKALSLHNERRWDGHGQGYCVCGHFWPCPTRLALDEDAAGKDNP